MKLKRLSLKERRSFSNFSFIDKYILGERYTQATRGSGCLQRMEALVKECLEFLPKHSKKKLAKPSATHSAKKKAKKQPVTPSDRVKRYLRRFKELHNCSLERDRWHGDRGLKYGFVCSQAVLYIILARIYLGKPVCWQIACRILRVMKKIPNAGVSEKIQLSQDYQTKQDFTHLFLRNGIPPSYLTSSHRGSYLATVPYTHQSDSAFNFLCFLIAQRTTSKAEVLRNAVLCEATEQVTLINCQHYNPCSKSLFYCRI